VAGLEFYIVNFFCLLHYDPASWFVSQILKVWSTSLQSFLIIFKIFIYHHWVRWKLISFFICFRFFYEFDFIWFSFFSNLYFLNCFFMFIPNYFGWFRILYCYFFLFSFYVVIWPYDLCHKFWRLDWVCFNYF